MKIDSRYFTSRRYRILYFLLPFMNGAAFMTAIAALYGIFGVDTTAGEFTGDIWADSIASNVWMMLWLAQGLAGGVLIAIADLAILGRIYRRNLITLLVESWRHPRRGDRPDLPFVAPMILTALGDMAVLSAIVHLSPWPVPPAVADVGPAFIFTALAYIFWVLPILAQAEKEETYGPSGETEGSSA